jgi:1,4-dihydroxy-2-naphthoyl-CoA synthase
VFKANHKFEALTYSVSGRVATVTLSRPGRFNAISSTMPYEIERAMFMANTDGTDHHLYPQRRKFLFDDSKDKILII